MKRLLLVTLTVFVFSSAANATLLFSTDFSNLTGWNSVYGEVVLLTGSSNSVLGFSHINSHGDTFSPVFNNTASTYWVTFDYFSTDLTDANGGGFFGIDEDGYKDGTLGGPNGSHTWLLGTPVYGSVDYLPQSDGIWQHISYSFAAPSWSTFSLMFEDFRGDSYDALFDNVKLYDSAPVPEPATIILLGSGLVGLAFLKRRSR